ncbi:MAG: S16 family serine protease [Candidatus Micrarchaeota archaeon]
MRRAVLLLLIISLSWAACTGNITQRVPAVVGNGGGLINVTISLAQGPGQVYISVFPRSGVTTQESIEQAVSYAYSLAESDEGCDVLVNFGANPSTDYIDGPSAGAALTVMTYALLANKSLRNDTVMTGTIGPSGVVGPVGGLYEKAKGAAQMGAKYFITPVENVYEIMVLREIESSYGIKILQAGNIEEVIGFMAENRSIEQEGLSIRDREVPNIPDFESSGMESFEQIASRMVDTEESLANRINGSDGEDASIRGFYQSEVKRQRGLIEKGYFFSAANEAFLNYVDISTIAAVSSGDPDLPRKKGEAGICLTGIEMPSMTDRNFEWVVGADQRQGWAYEKLDSTDIEDKLLVDEKFAAYNELMYAQAWCLVAKELIGAAPGGGTKINESAWMGLAKARILSAREQDPQDEETIRRLNIAQDAFENGRYGQAIFDSVYVIETTKADMETPDEGNISALVSENRSSLWGKVYQSHAAFLLAQNQSSGAYRTVRLAIGLDEAAQDMIGAMEPLKEPAKPAGKGTLEEELQDFTLPVILAGTISIFLFLVLLLMMTRRTHGTESKGPGKADRAEQEKGGAGVPGSNPRRKA